MLSHTLQSAKHNLLFRYYCKYPTVSKGWNWTEKSGLKKETLSLLWAFNLQVSAGIVWPVGNQIVQRLQSALASSKQPMLLCSSENKDILTF